MGVPTNTDYTDDVAARGLSAIRDRRAAQRYNRMTQRDALGAILGGNQYVGQGDPRYEAYLQSLHPQGYGMSFTRGGGKYNGWDTQGLMTTELEGVAEQLRGQDRARAQALQDMVDQSLGDIQSRYDDAMKNADIYQVNQGNGSSGWQAGRAAAAGHNVAGNGMDPRWDAYAKALEDWRDNASDQWLDAGDLANQIGMTPLRDYAMQAGGMLGIDPNLVAGWYPEASQIGDFQDQRDLEALNATGMTYDEYQRALSQFDQQNQDMAGQYQDAYDQQMADDVMNTYQVDIGAWASGAQLQPDQLYQVINTDAFMQLDDQIRQEMAAGSMDQARLTEIVRQAQGSPAIQNALLAYYTPWTSG